MEYLTERYTSPDIAFFPNQWLRNAIIYNNVMFLCEENNHRVSSWDLTNPILPVHMDNVAVQGPIDIKLSSDNTHVFVTGGFLAGTDSFYSIDITNPAALVLDDTLFSGVWMNNPHGCYVVGNYAYVACYQPGNRLTIIDVTNPAAMAYSGDLAVPSLDGAHDVVVEFPYAYVSSHFGTGGGANDGQITIVDVSNPAAPAFVWAGTELSQYAHIIKLGNYLFAGGAILAAPFNYLYAFDVSTPTVAPLASRIAGMYGYWLAIKEGPAKDHIISVGAVVIHVINITDPLNMVHEVTWTDPATFESIRNIVSLPGEKYIYVIGGNAVTTNGNFKVFEFNSTPRAQTDPATGVT